MDISSEGGATAAALTRDVTLGACRLMRDMGFSPMMEVTLGNGRRADIAGLNRRGRIAIVEVKTSLADLRCDAKWPDYLSFCDCFYFAVPEHFSLGVLAEEEYLPRRTGLIVADRFGGVVRRMAAEVPMNAARRRVETLSFARRAARRLHRQIAGEAGLAPGL